MAVAAIILVALLEVQGVAAVVCGKYVRMAKPQNTVMTIDELADYLELSKSTLYRLTRRGNVPGQKIGRYWRFHKAAIDKWLGQYAATRERERRTGRHEAISGNQRLG